MSLRLALLNAWLRRVEKPILARVPGPPEIRRRFDRTARLSFRDPPFACYLPDRLGDVPALWASVGARRPGAILYFHGGGYVFGSPETHKAMLARLSALTGLPACLPDYRLGPEHPFPAAVEDALAAWEGLLARGYAPDEIVLGGDSAGGGLMLALLGLLCRAGGPRPRAAFAFSPWTDLTLSGASMAENAATEALLPVERVAETRDYYMAGSDPEDPCASPLFAAFPGVPPVLIQASRSEILRDDTLRMAERLEAQGGRIELQLWENAPHVWQIFQGWLPEAEEALANVARFLAAQPAAETSR